ncbi:hypothetical protein L1049_006027 [Liquidambar formosana]|uniref:Uncharacterized protein n=1 Tax=Liquidambar formosana TaxID=63359 RepID=A0AAP0RGN9_LIQFO
MGQARPAKTPKDSPHIQGCPEHQRSSKMLYTAAATSPSSMVMSNLILKFDILKTDACLEKFIIALARSCFAGNLQDLPLLDEIKATGPPLDEDGSTYCEKLLPNVASNT